MVLRVGDHVTTAPKLRPGRFAERRGVVVAHREGEFGVTWSARADFGHAQADAWFRPDELSLVKVRESPHTHAEATQPRGPDAGPHRPTEEAQ